MTRIGQTAKPSPAAPRRVLVISPTATHPPTAGNRARVLAICNTLRELGHDVHFAYVKRDSPGDEAAMRAYFGDRFHLVSYAQPGRRETGLQKFSRRVRSLWSTDARYAYAVDDWYDDAIDAPIAALHQRHGFHAVIVEYVFLSRALELFDAGTTKIIDTHDVFANRHRMFLARGLPPEWFSTTTAEEAKGLARADVVIAIQDEERRHHQALGVKRVVEVGHVLSVERRYPNALRAPAADMLFVGGSSPINADAVTEFAQHTLGLIRAQHPQARVLIAGGVCERLPDLAGCLRLGKVQDLAGTYAAADLVINPVRLGTGLNIKSFEALGYGMPLLASPAGARGLEAAAGRALVVAEGPQALARAACGLLADAAARQVLSDAAWEFVNESNRRHANTLAGLIAG